VVRDHRALHIPGFERPAGAYRFMRRTSYCK
jgi:hypothetical protein